MSEAYHKYVFDTKGRKFVGAFEEMYKKEDAEGFDSWHQDDTSNINRQLTLAILNYYNFKNILDIGCGKGAFTNLLKNETNVIKGIDLSPTAIKKAQERYPDIEFIATKIEDFLESSTGVYDLAVMIEVLSYIESWKEVIKRIFEISEHLFISVYIPTEPIGFVKNFDDLTSEISKYADTVFSSVINKESLFILAQRR